MALLLPRESVQPMLPVLAIRPLALVGVPLEQPVQDLERPSQPQALRPPELALRIQGMLHAAVEPPELLRLMRRS
jgi:hypothetical protein